MEEIRHRQIPTKILPGKKASFLSKLFFWMCQPWLIGELLSSISNSKSAVKESCYLYGSLIMLSSFLSVLATHFYHLKIQHLGMKIRICICSLIYRKTLKINKNDLIKTNVGKIINLLSNDVNRFDLGATHVLQLFLAPVETIFIVYCMYVTVGPTATPGIAMLILFIPVQMYLGKLTTVYRQRTAAKTDTRIKLMDEVLSGIHAIKMFTWEDLFTQMILKARKFEIRQIMKVSFIRAFNVSFMLIMNRLGIFLSVITYALTQKEINAKYVFVLSSFYAMLRQTVTVYIPFGIQNFGEIKVSMQRIKEFLMKNEICQESKEESIIYISKENQALLVRGKFDEHNENEVRPVRVLFENVSVKWLKSVESYVLNSINFQVSTNELVVITGRVGSGKSTFLYSILKEMPLNQGKLDVVGSVSYAPQEPWLFSGTIRQNILFGSTFDKSKYNKILKICQLLEDISMLSEGDNALVGERGNTLSVGQKARICLARAVYRDVDIYLLDDPLAAVDAKVGKRIFEDCILEYLKDKCRILVTHHSSYLVNAASRIYVLDEGMLTSDPTHEKINFIRNADDENDFTSIPKPAQSNMEQEEKQRYESKRVYQKYARAGGSHFSALSLLLLFIFAQGAASGVDFFVAYWSDVMHNDKTKQIFNMCIWIYASIMIATVIFSIIRSMTFFKFCLKASTNLHNEMFSKIIRAPMMFFKTTSTGKILNRFSKDVGLIDESLPLLLMDTFQITFIILGSTILVTYVNPWMVFPTVGIFVIFYIFKIKYLDKSRNMKRLEAEARSPIYSHMHATIQGLTIIRTHNIQTILKSEFDHHQDVHSSAFYIFMTCTRAFGFWLDLSCVIYTAVAIITIMLIDTSAGNAGLSITQSINLIGVLQWGIRQWSEAQNQMINVERIVEYTKVPQEVDSTNNRPPKNWPNNGEIKFESVFLKYADRSILDNINFTVRPKEKIGIVGRTGAGKSSLISALFRLYDAQGNILIDNVNTEEIPLHTLRSSVTVIPQEPILFNGSLRDNLDPYHELNDEVLWKVLEDTGLKSTVMSLPDNLHNKILQGGSNFSVGERQIICLARGLLKKNKIIMFDEATASIDFQTDHSIQQRIKRNFQDCTILTIAHRLDTVMESDRILVMNNGRIVEFDHPQSLLQNSQTLFSQLVTESEKNCNILQK